MSGFYEQAAFIRIYAETPEEARERAADIAAECSRSADFTLGIEDGEPILDEEDSENE